MTEKELEEKIKIYAEENRIENSKENLEKIKNIILRGEITSKDLGGVTAIRGFVYQYYLAILFIVEMFYLKDAWWNQVSFELFDDIALHSDTKIRLIQSKTIKEEKNEHKNITIGKIVDRKKGYDSWLDKLFINGEKYCIEGIEVEYQLATNNCFNEKLATYFNNEKFNTEIKENDELYKKLSEEFEEKDTQKTVESIYKKIDLKNCLGRFHCAAYGNFEMLKDNIKEKLKETKFSVDERLDSSIFDIVIKKMMTYLIDRTKNDSLKENQILQFFIVKEEIEKELLKWIESAKNEVSDRAREVSSKAIFNDCFIQLDKKFKKEWEILFYDELKKELEDLKREFENVQKNDELVYAKTLNRIFNCNQDTIYSKEDDDEYYLKKTIELLIYYLVFFSEKKYLFKEGNFLFKKCKMEKDEVYTVVNGRQRTLTQVKRDISSSAKKCLISKKLKHSYVCFLESVVGDDDDNGYNIVPNSLTKHSIVKGEIFDNIKIIKGEEISKLMNGIKKLTKKDIEDGLNSFKKEKIRSCFLKKVLKRGGLGDI